MTLHRTIRLALGLSLAMALSTAATAQEANWYVGIQGGQSKADLDQDEFDALTVDVFSQFGNFVGGDSSLDDGDTTWSIFGGFRVNQYIAFEAGYLDLGSPSYRADVSFEPFGVPPAIDAFMDIEFNATGFTTAFIGSLPLGEMFDLHGRLGIFFSETELKLRVGDDQGSEGDKLSGDDTDIFYGAGAAMHFGPSWSVSLDYQLYKDVGNEDETGETDVDSVTLAAIYRF
ncbi:OOP family OmpA-OmpF porin [Povalibacter uvarum]|uniref:OOP family OmpA-OmpF porin n=1 Tax=Povalibacter uvarum TaxID=732238 RepID=A0A841HM32_9GAMM|nr:outer membrane beta-barrel protein [Povalibacter uvarum]MBB6093152.1 OOP family OmpA-OmpF porin [Povalibacter uvarum]